MPALKISGGRRLALGLAVLMLALAMWRASLPALDWNRGAIAHGQWYRLLTAHLVHLGSSHLLMNVMALILLAELFWQQLRAREVALILLASAFGVSLGLLWMLPDLWRYAGLSGVLHGAWAGSALLLLHTRSADPARPWWAVALLLLAAKLLIENLHGSGLTAEAIGAPVILPSHALGALAGVCCAGLMIFAQSRLRNFRPRLAALPVFD
jgi:rhomboid family GlyGly-CTERM serine protease